ncbi:MAG: hypothetical protein Q9161_000918 [Pseudevernia consocians]
MSEGEGGGDIAATANEGEDGVAVPLMMDESQAEGKAVATPTKDEGKGVDHVSPAMSYEKSTDHIQPVTSMTKYEGKGKGRTGSFSHLPVQGDSAPSTAPTTRPVSQDQADTELSTAESTPPVSPAQGEYTPIAAQSTLPLKNLHVAHDCGCADIYDHTGKKRQQACNRHKLNPSRSVLPLPPKVPLNEATNRIGSGSRTVYTPQTERNEESPPPGPPVVTLTKGRNFVQGSENGPNFLDPFNSERAIEPTGPPNTLTTIPTQPDKPLKKSKNSAGTASGPAFKKRFGQPKSILKKTVGTTAEARQAERGRSSRGQVNNNEEPKENREGVELFQKTVGRLQAGEGNGAANNASGPDREDQGGVRRPAPPTPTHRNGGPVSASPLADTAGGAGDDDSSGDEGMTCNHFVLM